MSFDEEQGNYSHQFACGNTSGTVDADDGGHEGMDDGLMTITVPVLFNDDSDKPRLCKGNDGSMSSNHTLFP